METDGNKEDMLIALNNSISIDFRYAPDNDDKMDSGLTYSEYKKEYINAVKRYNSGIWETSENSNN